MINREYQRRPLTAGEKAEIERLHAEGEPFAAIGAAVGRSGDVVRQHLIRRGAYEPLHRNTDEDKQARIIDDYNRNLFISVIARRHAITPHTIYRTLRRHNVPLRCPAVSEGMKGNRA